MIPDDEFDRIQRENDEFRQTRGSLDDSMLWQAGLVSRGHEFWAAALEAIRSQSNFDYDLAGLHDFGTVEVNGEPIEWMIVYLDENDRDSSPTNARKRVMTIAPLTDVVVSD